MDARDAYMIWTEDRDTWQICRVDVEKSRGSDLPNIPLSCAAWFCVCALRTGLQGYLLKIFRFVLSKILFLFIFSLLKCINEICSIISTLYQ